MLLCCNTRLFAETHEGMCGENVNWTLDTETGALNIFSDAETNVRMYDYGDNNSSNKAPWANYRDSITSVTMSDNILNVGTHAFYQCRKLETIKLPANLVSIDRCQWSPRNMGKLMGLTNGK